MKAHSGAPAPAGVFDLPLVFLLLACPPDPGCSVIFYYPAHGVPVRHTAALSLSAKIAWNLGGYRGFRRDEPGVRALRERANLAAWTGHQQAIGHFRKILEAAQGVLQRQQIPYIYHRLEMPCPNHAGGIMEHKLQATSLIGKQTGRNP